MLETISVFKGLLFMIEQEQHCKGHSGLRCEPRKLKACRTHLKDKPWRKWTMDRIYCFDKNGKTWPFFLGSL